MRSEKISVCMATYNGELYIKEQIDSILPQLIEGDEIIIVDDCSKDSTVEIANSYSDSRISVVVNEKNLGVNGNFEKAMKLAKNEYIFLADQDDIWTEGRVEIMLEKLRAENVDAVAGNIVAIDSEGKFVDFDFGKLFEKDSKKKSRNLIKFFLGKAYYYGCAMALKKSFLQVVLPFPEYMESHDLWIMEAAILKGTCLHIEKDVLFRRVHGNNASLSTRPLRQKLYSRIIFLKSYFNLKKRIKKQRKNKREEK